jgi:hypothetical protein
MVAKYQDNEGCRWWQRQRRNIGGGGTAAAEKDDGYWRGVDENDKGRLIWGRRWQRCCNVDLLLPGQAREGVYLGDFKKKYNLLGASPHACSRQVILQIISIFALIINPTSQ